MFPTSISGTVELPVLTPEQTPALVSALNIALEGARAFDISRTGNAITFRGGIFRFVSNLNVLVPVSSGVIEVRPGAPGTIVFRFSCMQLLIIVTVMALLTGFVIPSNQPLAFKLGMPALMWLWLFGMNYLIAKIRLPAFIRRLTRC